VCFQCVSVFLLKKHIKNCVFSMFFDFKANPTKKFPAQGSLDCQMSGERAQKGKRLHNEASDGDNCASYQDHQNPAHNIKEPNDAGHGYTETEGIDEGQVHYRRQTTRKDGRTRTHKKKTPLVMGPPPSAKRRKEQQDRDASRRHYRWWLTDY
jgi:hypothetical protein